MFGFNKTAAIAVAGAAFAVAAIALPASAASLTPPGSCAVSTTTMAHSYVSPIHGGQALNAINWGGSGRLATACTGAVTNDNLKTWHYPGSSVASDFTAIPLGGTVQPAVCTTAPATGCYQLEYTPGNQLSGLCISTVLDLKGAYARLRPCAGLATSGIGSVINQWQDFAFIAVGDGFNQIEAILEPTPYSLNIAGFGGNGTQVISWTPMAHDACSDGSPATVCSENEIFETLHAS